MEDIRSMMTDPGTERDSIAVAKEIKFSETLESMRGLNFEELISGLGLQAELAVFEADYDVKIGKETEELFDEEMKDLFMGTKLLIDLGECHGVTGDEFKPFRDIREAIKRKDSVREANGLPTYRETLMIAAKEPETLEDVWRQRECWRYISDIERVIENRLIDEVSSISEAVDFRNNNGIPSFKNFMVGMSGEGATSLPITIDDVREYYDRINGLLLLADGSSYINIRPSFDNSRNSAFDNHHGNRKINFVNGDSSSACKGNLYHVLVNTLNSADTSPVILNVLCDAPVSVSSVGSYTYMK